MPRLSKELGTGSAPARTVPQPGSDAALLAAIAAGDDAAFTALWNRYYQPILAFVRRRVADAGEAEDVTQEVWLRAHRHAASFQGRSAVSTWLFGIARNECLFRLRTIGRRRNRETELGREPLPERPDVLHVAVARESAVRALQALGELPEESRALLLATITDESTDELARRFGCSPGALKTRRSRARDRLRQELAAC